METHNYLHWGTFIIAALSASLGVAGSWAVFYARVATMGKKLKDLEKTIENLDENLARFSEKCAGVEKRFGEVMTRDKHEQRCNLQQQKCFGNVCAKFAEIKKTILGVDKKVDHNQETTAGVLGEIMRSLGRIEGNISRGNK